MKEIELTQGKVALIDNEDYEIISQYKWYYNNSGYARTRINNKSKLLHKLLIETELEIDHINTDKLDNRRCNLRIVNRINNSRNKKKNIKYTSKYKGVCWLTRDKKWKASITVNYKQIILGYYDSEKEAAKKYNEAVLTYFENYGILNDIGE